MFEDIKNKACDISDGAVLAYDMKRDEISKMPLHQKYAKVLTPDEVRRSQRIGLVIGMLVLLAAIVFVIWWLL